MSPSAGSERRRLNGAAMLRYLGRVRGSPPRRVAAARREELRAMIPWIFLFVTINDIQKLAG